MSPVTSRKPIVPKLLSNKRPETREAVQKLGNNLPDPAATIFDKLSGVPKPSELSGKPEECS